MPKRTGICIIVMGALLILSALLLLLYNRVDDQRAGREAESMMADLEALIGAAAGVYDPADAGVQTGSEASGLLQAGVDPEAASVGEAAGLPAEMPVVEVNGYEYVGYIEIPILQLQLPVMSDWDYTRLKIAPCRHMGSSRTDDLVIAAHNYRRHFGYLEYLEPGNTVIFTDMDGIVNTYQVAEVSVHQPTETDAVLNSGCDLVLYTCTYGGKTRVTVFCSRKTGE